jgi:hypothetical protein
MEGQEPIRIIPIWIIRRLQNYEREKQDEGRRPDRKKAPLFGGEGFSMRGPSE